MEFWHYDPEDGRGWYVYGSGSVTPDGRQIAPDPGVSIHEFTGAMVSPSSLAALLARLLANFFGWGGDPVDLGTGLFILNKTDLELPDTLPLTLQRWYRPNDTRSRAFGIGASHLYDMFLVGDTFPYTYVDLILPDGARVHYTRTSVGTNYWDAVYEHTSSPSAWFKSQVRWNGRGWNLTTRDGTLYVFPEAYAANRPQQAALLKIQDRRGNVLTVMRNNHRDITRVIAPHGRWLEFTYDSSFRVTRVADNLGREVLYQYDASGRLWKVTDAVGGVTEYTYDTNHRMLTLKDARGIVYLTNEYDANGRVSRQTQADDTTYEFAYTLDGAGKVTEAEVTDPRGHVRRVTFNAAGYSTSQTEALGTALARTTNLTRQANTNLLLSLTDPLSRKTAYTYDSMGNPTSVTRLADTSEAVTTSLTYESTFNQVASITDALNHTTTFGYDAEGNLTSVTAPLNRQTTATYDGLGLPLSVTNALGHTPPRSATSTAIWQP
ncbi:MAG TPA: DUF6531 domain-containing protein [Vicinamibacterales bacterium]|jgi:YD repeat-containing protein|nr:DUF6531 domain-containing protein [Vicinamibacterales bacterium]